MIELLILFKSYMVFTEIFNKEISKIIQISRELNRRKSIKTTMKIKYFTNIFIEYTKSIKLILNQVVCDQHKIVKYSVLLISISNTLIIYKDS